MADDLTPWSDARHALEATAFEAVREVLRTFPGSAERNAVVWRGVTAYGAVVGPELERLRAELAEAVTGWREGARLIEALVEQVRDAEAGWATARKDLDAAEARTFRLWLCWRNARNRVRSYRDGLRLVMENEAKAEAAIERVRAWLFIADEVDVTDWQRGYRAAAERAYAALDTPTPTEETGDTP